MTQQQMAECLEVTLRSYQRIESGEILGKISHWDAAVVREIDIAVLQERQYFMFVKMEVLIMLVQEMNLGPTKVRIFDDECVSREEAEEILKRVSRIVQNAYIAQETRKRKDAAP